MGESYQISHLDLKEEIAKEQKQRDDNVNEYLRMAQNADKSQLPRLKAIFEKRNKTHNVEIHKAQVICQMRRNAMHSGRVSFRKLSLTNLMVV